MTVETGPVRVTLADDEPLILSGLRMALGHDPSIEVVGEAGDGVAALELIRRERPAVALVDIRMPRLDGIEVASRITADETLVATRVVVLTTFADDQHLVAAVQAGASGYLLKSMPPEDIRAGVHAAARGDTSLAPSLVRRLLEEYAGRSTPRDPRLDRLTEREADVLREVARGRSNVEIGLVLFVSEGTVKTHVAAVLRKLELRDRTQAAVAAYELGLVRIGDGQARPSG
jgi:DNA-binding NarL/FixJ family response regulator